MLEDDSISPPWPGPLSFAHGPRGQN